MTHNKWRVASWTLTKRLQCFLSSFMKMIIIFVSAPLWPIRICVSYMCTIYIIYYVYTIGYNMYRYLRICYMCTADKRWMCVPNKKNIIFKETAGGCIEIRIGLSTFFLSSLPPYYPTTTTIAAITTALAVVLCYYFYCIKCLPVIVCFVH